MNEEKTATPAEALTEKKQTRPELVQEVGRGLRRLDWMLVILSVAVNALAWGVLLWKVPQADRTFFLHYNVYFGVDLAGEWHQLLYTPLSGLVVLLLNVAFLNVSRNIPRLIKTVALTVTLVLELVVLLASILLVLLNN